LDIVLTNTLSHWLHFFSSSNEESV